MAVNDPAAPAAMVPESGKASDLPEPAVIAEAGVTTSEWKLALGYLVQLAATGSAAALAKAHLSLDPSYVSMAANFEVIAAFIVASYVVSRGVRKLGSSK